MARLSMKNCYLQHPFVEVVASRPHSPRPTRGVRTSPTRWSGMLFNAHSTSLLSSTNKQGRDGNGHTILRIESLSIKRIIPIHVS